MISLGVVVVVCDNNGAKSNDEGQYDADAADGGTGASEKELHGISREQSTTYILYFFPNDS